MANIALLTCCQGKRTGLEFLWACPNIGNVIFLGVLAQSLQIGVERDFYDDFLLCHCCVSSHTELGIAAFNMRGNGTERERYNRITKKPPHSGLVLANTTGADQFYW
jgi:hypothetical protein